MTPACTDCRHHAWLTHAFLSEQAPRTLVCQHPQAVRHFGDERATVVVREWCNGRLYAEKGKR